MRGSSNEIESRLETWGGLFLLVNSTHDKEKNKFANEIELVTRSRERGEDGTERAYR